MSDVGRRVERVSIKTERARRKGRGAPAGTATPIHPTNPTKLNLDTQLPNDCLESGDNKGLTNWCW